MLMEVPKWLSGKESACQCRRPGFNPWVGKIPWRRERLPPPIFWPGDGHGVTKSRTRLNEFHFLLPRLCSGKESACHAGDSGDASLILGLERSPGEGKGYPLQYSGLENSMDCRVHEVPKSWTQLSDFYFHSINKTR